MSISNPMVEKIKKLLSLANSCNENEAKLAASKAAELLLKHNLTLQQISESQFDYIEKEIHNEGQKINFHQAMILGLISKHYFVKVMIVSFAGHGRHFRQKQIQIIGKNENVEIAGYIYSYLTQTYPVLWAQYRALSDAPLTAKKSYFQGLTTGIDEVLQNTRFRVEQECGLVLVADQKLEDLVNKRCTKSYSARPPTLDSEAYFTGVNDGQKLTLKRPIESEKRDDKAPLLDHK